MDAIRVGKVNFFIYYEVDGDTSKHCLQSSTYLRPGERVGPLRTRSVSQGGVGVLIGSRGGYAALFLFLFF